MDAALTLNYLVPNALYRGTLVGNTQQEYNNLNWRDARPKPTWQELLDAYDDAVSSLPTDSYMTSQKFAIIQDRKLAWQDSGTWTAWAWRTHDLNHLRFNNIVGLSIANHRITIPAGIYKINFYATAYRVDKFIYRIYDITKDDNTPLIESLTGYARNHNSGDNNITSTGGGICNFDVTTAIELQGHGQNTRATDGFGLKRNLGDVGGYDPDNIFAQVELIKLG